MEVLRNRNGKGMILIDDRIAKDIPSLFEAMADEDPLVRCKLFTVTGWRWFVLGLDRESLVAYCFVTSPRFPEGEYGAVDLRQLSRLTMLSGSLGIERDLYFDPRPLSQLLDSGE